MGQSPLVIVNPASAGGGTLRAWAKIASDLATHFGSFDCLFTNGPGHGRTLAMEAAADGRQFIIACGGDGTISEVANGILESGEDSELGVLPNGTGGDLRRSLEMPIRHADAARSLRLGRTRRMDVGFVSYTNHRGNAESRCFLGVASFGMSGEVIARVKRHGSNWAAAITTDWLGGKAAFARAMLQTALSEPAKDVVVRLDASAERSLKITNFCVANARYFGGGMKIAPKAVLDDGYFDVVQIGDLSSLEILTNSPKIYVGAHLGMEQVRYEKARTVEARPGDSKVEILLEIDGELPGRLPARFEIRPSALRVRCT